MIEKKAEGLVELAQSSRRYPTFRFEQVRDSGRDVLKIKGVKKAFGDNEVLHGVDLLVQRGERLAVMGPNGIGKSTLLKIVMGELEVDEGEVEWGYETHPGYFAQDHRDQLAPPQGTAEGWVWDCCPEKDIGFVRSRMALMLFSGDDSKKRLSALSGGEAARARLQSFGHHTAERARAGRAHEPSGSRVDRSPHRGPKNLSRNTRLRVARPLVRQQVGHPAIVEITRDEIPRLPRHVRGVRALLWRRPPGCRPRNPQGEDPETEEGWQERGSRECAVQWRRQVEGEESGGRAPEARAEITKGAPASISKARRKRLQMRQDELTARIDTAEARIREIDELFCEPTYYERTPLEEVTELEAERTGLHREVADHMGEWGAERGGNRELIPLYSFP